MGWTRPRYAVAFRHGSDVAQDPTIFELGTDALVSGGLSCDQLKADFDQLAFMFTRYDLTPARKSAGCLLAS